MKTLGSYVKDRWVTGNAPFATLLNPATEEPLAHTSTGGIDMGAALDHARSRGGPALRELTFAQRGELLRAWSKALHEKRDELIALAMQNGGNTRSDAKFDVDGAIGTLAHYAELGAQLGSLRALRDGEPVQIGRTARYAGVHLWVPRDGVAVHINAFNFPAWGTAEKAACALLAGAGTWLVGESANHIGASGVIFGYLGYLLFRPAFAEPEGGYRQQQLPAFSNVLRNDPDLRESLQPIVRDDDICIVDARSELLHGSR